MAKIMPPDMVDQGPGRLPAACGGQLLRAKRTPI
jgi:hypothetical protein